jgi:hypothetical protein
VDAADQAEIERWWRRFVDTGRLPAGLPLVQGRLVRAVHRGLLPSGPVFVKVMTFPRGKDRLRYLLRALPGQHEAKLLAATEAAGIVCPEVVAVRGARRRGMPFRSMLVLRALEQRDEEATVDERLAAEAVLAARLLAAGIVHRDLHSGNFLLLADGRLAVLDLQSASLALRRPGPARRVATAVRLLQDRAGLPHAAAAAALLQSGLLRDESEVERAWAAVAVARAHFVRGRIRRCLAESTEFTRRRGLRGVLHRTRGELGEGRWLSGGRELRRAWLGQRAAHVLDGQTPIFRAYLQKSWWFGGGGGLYAPRACSEETIEAGLRNAIAAYERHADRIEGRASTFVARTEAHGGRTS